MIEPRLRNSFCRVLHNRCASLATRILAQSAAVAQTKKKRRAIAMRKVTIGLVVLGVLALAFISMPMRAQNQGSPFPGYPPEMAPSRTSRPRPPAPPNTLPNKFNRAARAVPNEYIVALNDDTPNANVPSIINGLAKAHAVVIKHNWGDTLKGFSVRMPEAEAIALSNDPHVKYVVENGYATALQAQLTPWALVRISHEGPVGSITDDGFALNGTFSAPNDGSGVHVYVIDSGIRPTHHQFGNRASVAWDTVDDDNNPSTPTNSDGSGADGIDCLGDG